MGSNVMYIKWFIGMVLLWVSLAVLLMQMPG